jgi:predicted 3-demethylubiquinone-9 3-methyltransferase (glyoxalase superfamily)
MKITPFLMFDGRADEAMALYASLFPDARIAEVERYSSEQAGAEGGVKRALLRLAGCELICIDSPVKHAFSFTPSISLFVNLDARAQFDRVFDALSAHGKVLMAPGDYGSAQWFAWIEDRFGVTWQLRVP